MSNMPLAVVFFAAGFPATIFSIFIANIIEWFNSKHRWHVIGFNFSNELATFYLVSLAYNGILDLSPNDPVYTILAMIVVSAVYAFLETALLSLIFWFADRRKAREMDLLTPLHILREFSLMSIGAAAVLVWRMEPLASILVLSPLYIQFVSFKLPNLMKKVKDDPKTGVLNAEAFRRELDKELSRANRLNRPLTLVMCDLDHMRMINNTYGHLAGDQVLIAVSKMLKKSFREVDTVARYGGEEFVIILPGVGHDDAGVIAERARANIEGMFVEASHANCDIRVTVSFGVSSKESPHQTPEDLIHNTDVALYYAKENGRNCIGVLKDASSIQLIVPAAFSYEQHEMQT
jgi:diguanylate cyclase (GGDEF)-like protein